MTKGELSCARACERELTERHALRSQFGYRCIKADQHSFADWRLDDYAVQRVDEPGRIC